MMITKAKKTKDAVAVFVKTPALSPVKTRLAKSIGRDKALSAYRQSVAAMRAVMTAIAEESAGRVQPFWAVAESEGISRREWRDFPVMHTGEGDLGARLHNVYSSLRCQWRRVALIGSDCPQMPPQLVINALADSRGRAVIAPATDGGFCLFAAGRRLPSKIWTRVSYSQSDTLAQLLALLPMPVKRLPPLTDMDDIKTLREVIKQLQTAPLPKQRHLATKLAALME